MTWDADLTKPRKGQMVLLACKVGRGLETSIVARRHGFEDGNVVTMGWQCTFSGRRLPNDWEPYAWADPTPPNPALLDGDDY
jgi:hypothetical protein